MWFKLRPNGWITGVLGLYMKRSSQWNFPLMIWALDCVLALLCTQVYCSLSSAAMCLHPYSEGEGISCSFLRVLRMALGDARASSFLQQHGGPRGRSQEEASSVFQLCWTLLRPMKKAFMEAGIPSCFCSLGCPYYHIGSQVATITLPHF